MSLTHVVVFTSYIDLVVQRATGELPTPAAWIRTFVQSHPAYKHDSVVSQEVGQILAMSKNVTEHPTTVLALT